MTLRRACPIGWRRTATCAAGLCAALLLSGCATARNGALAIDAHLLPAVEANQAADPSVDAPSIVSPYRDNWTPQRIVVSIARPWSQPSLRLGDWPARSDRDRARYPYPAASAADPGEAATLVAMPVLYEVASAALELATALPRAFLYTTYAPTREALDPFERAPVWERPREERRPETGASDDAATAPSAPP